MRILTVAGMIVVFIMAVRLYLADAGGPARVEFTTEPYGARVTVDGHPLAVGVVYLPPQGTYRVQVTALGYAAKAFLLTNPARGTIHVKLDPDPPAPPKEIRRAAFDVDG